MKENTLKLGMVLCVGLVALVGLFTLVDYALFSDIAGAAISPAETSMTQEMVDVPASAGCCNWDCEHYIWVCKTRDMQCSLGKPGFSCKE